MYHREYPIRCKSCNEQLACYSEKYEELSKDYDYETALNMLGIMEPCSRYNMMNPTMILSIRENRNLIEGLEDIDVTNKFSGELSFRTCIDKITNVDYTQAEKPVESKSEVTSITSLLPSIVKKQQQQKQSALISSTKPAVTKSTFKVSNQITTSKTITMSLAKQLEQKESKQPIKELSTKVTEEDKAIDIIDEVHGPVEFIYPTVVGIPTINSSDENVKIHIGGKYYVDVLSGRTYLCR